MVPDPGSADEALYARARSALQQHWGYPDFRPGQWDAMSPILHGRDALVILPTGGGKSLCFQVPALLQEGVTIVISPLLALMDDQVGRLEAQGVRATAINSTLSYTEIEQRWNDAVHGRYRLLYMAPERLQSEMFEARAGQLNVAMLAIDEAHCVSEWGYSFRPAYLGIAEARARIGDPPTIAVTATATPYVRRDMMERLGLRSPAVVVTGFDRPNLTWSIFRLENKRAKLLEIVKRVDGTGVVYAGTRRGVEQWAEWLAAEGFSAGFYHAGLSPEARKSAQVAWLEGSTRIMVATNAFGMGIDKSDVRFVVHVDLPSTIESYYQEAGRGGRDGGRAHAVLLYRKGDESTPAGLLEKSLPRRVTVQAVYDALCSLNEVSLGELPDRPLPVNPQRIAKVARCPTGAVRSVLELLERQQELTIQAAAAETLYLRMLSGPEKVRELADQSANSGLGRFLYWLLRRLPSEVFSGWCRVSVHRLLRDAKMPRERLERGLNFLKERDVLQWMPGDAIDFVELRRARSARLDLDDSLLRQARNRSQTRLGDMLRYARSITCRRRFLLSYFGESSPEHCGACDVCLGRHEPIVVTPEHEPALRTILQYVADGTAREAWFTSSTSPKHEIDGLLDWLVREGYLQIADPLLEEFALTGKARRMLGRSGR